MAFAYTKLMQAMVAAGVVTPTDPYFNLVTLLLPGNGTNGAQNNTFLDSSSNNFTITRNGNTTQGTFSPFSQTGWSNFFDGSSAYLTVADNAALDLGTGNFTIEAWIFATSVSPATNFTIVAKGASSAAGTWQFDITSGSKLRLQYDTAGAITSTASLVANTWNHVAVVREGTGSNQTKIYINGTNDGTGTVSSDLGDASTVKIGLNRDGTTYFPGYISNLRIVKGTAVYTSAFTPPTSALTAITNTSLLTCQSNRFIDNSSNAFAITVNGTPSVQAFSPFAPTAAYSTTDVGGSGYFDGTGDYLATGLATALDNISGDFTIEYWQYPIAGQPALSPVLGSANGSFSGTASFVAYEESSNKLNLYLNATQATSLISYAATTKLINQWSHVAWVRSGSVITLYLNGTSVATVTYTNTISLNTTNSNTYIGRNGWDAYYWYGYISGLRIVKGTAIVPSGAPTTPPTAVTNTQLLLNYTNAGITDATAKNDLETAGNASISTAQSKFGGSSMYFDGTGDYLKLPDNAMFSLSGGNYTIEFWLYLNSVTGVQVLVERFSAPSGPGYTLYMNGTAVELYGSSVVFSSGTLATGQWYHIAVSKSGSTTYLFINGTQSTSTTNNIGDSAQPVYIGARTGTSLFLNGYIDDLRITKGYARYTANFTVTTTTFPLQ